MKKKDKCFLITLIIAIILPLVFLLLPGIESHARDALVPAVVINPTPFYEIPKFLFGSSGLELTALFASSVIIRWGISIILTVALILFLCNAKNKILHSRNLQIIGLFVFLGLWLYQLIVTLVTITRYDINYLYFIVHIVDLVFALILLNRLEILRKNRH